MKDLTLIRIKNTDFPRLYYKLLSKEQLSSNEYQKLLSIAVIMLNSKDFDVQKLGYRIIVLYGNQTNDYAPLYEVSLNLGLIPVVHFISALEQYSGKESFFAELNNAFTETFRSDELYQSIEQKELHQFYFNNLNSTVSIIAPTSYGKTDLIINTIAECREKRICVITPTKSLLAQTKMRIMKANIDGVKKIITHPEMYNENEENIIAVLTQERLLRLLKKSDSLYFDYIIVDEAHGLLQKDGRNTLLASVLIILEKRNPNIKFKFLTPFLCESRNLEVRFSNYNVNNFQVSEYVKSEKYYIYNPKERLLEFYDQFMNEFITLDSDIGIDDIEFIEYNRAAKNIIYLNKPSDIEEFSYRFALQRSTIESQAIDKACHDIADYIHPSYNLIECLRKGLIYHHGSVPESIRLYIERLYETEDLLSYVITSSTLLEGVNLPAERMFILDNKKGPSKLSPSHFKNLVGRICRFNDIFNSTNQTLHKLEPDIYMVLGNYYSKNANVRKFLQDTVKVNLSIKDNPQNTLLKETPLDQDNKEQFEAAQEFIENYENGTIPDYNKRYVTTEVGKSCYLNSITEIDIFQNEQALQRRVEYLRGEQFMASNPEQLLNIIYDLFLKEIDVDDHNIRRFSYLETRRFYTMFLNWRITGASYAQMINSFLRHWDKLLSESRDTIIFVGRWGDTTREGYNPLWTDIKDKSSNEKVNLAIVRIKEEQDFLDNVIIKFIEVLNDLDLVKESLYLKIKYGTDDKRKILLVKNGLTLSLSNLLIDKYIEYLNLDLENSIVEFRESLVEIMKSNNENQVIITEAEYFAK